MTSRGTKYWDSGAIPLIAPEILGNIIAELADLAIVIAEDGLVLSVLYNPAQTRFEGLDVWEGKNVRNTLMADNVAKFETRLAEFLSTGGPVRPIEINHIDGSGTWDFPIRYSLHRIGPDGAILMLGRDLRPIAEMQEQLVKAQMALEQDYEAQRESDTKFRVMMESTREAFLFVAPQSGRITEANGIAAATAGVDREALPGSSFSSTFELVKRGDAIEALNTQALAERPVPISVVARNTGIRFKITPTLFRASGERLLLCRIDPEDDADSKSDSLTQNLSALYQLGPDAIVFADDRGTVLSANESFLDLIDAAHDISVKGRSMADYLLRGSVDLKVLTENAARSGRMRMYPTKIAGAYRNPRSVEISATTIQAGSSTIFAFVIRDASRIEQSRPNNGPVTDDNVRSVMELVGSATLKDIVAETTNVVERMCIETAVELTMNNRVAAAEMLGLSRQSLYVKLRKYDLLTKGGSGADDV